MKKIILASALSLYSLTSLANVAVIVNPNNANNLDAETIKKIYLGKLKSYDNGSKVNPVNQDGNTITDEFNEKVVGKSSSQLNAYWSKLVFTGKGTPPEKLSSDQAVIDYVSGNNDAIGYIDGSKVSDKVKVVATF